MMVVPSERERPLRSLMIVELVWLSRFPCGLAGEDDRRSVGESRAIATRCRSPPLRRLGLRCYLSRISSACSSSCAARGLRSLLATPMNSTGAMTFSVEAGLGTRVAPGRGPVCGPGPQP